jgi:adenosine/AMP kinase
MKTGFAGNVYVVYVAKAYPHTHAQLLKNVNEKCKCVKKTQRVDIFQKLRKQHKHSSSPVFSRPA